MKDKEESNRNFDRVADLLSKMSTEEFKEVDPEFARKAESME